MDKIHTNKQIRKYSACLVIGNFKPRPQRHLLYSFNQQYLKILEIPSDYHRIYRIFSISLMRGKTGVNTSKSIWHHLLKLSFHKTNSCSNSVSRNILERHSHTYTKAAICKHSRAALLTLANF